MKTRVVEARPGEIVPQVLWYTDWAGAVLVYHKDKVIDYNLEHSATRMLAHCAHDTKEKAEDVIKKLKEFDEASEKLYYKKPSSPDSNEHHSNHTFKSEPSLLSLLLSYGNRK